MILPDAKTVDHVSPYKRVELGAGDKKSEPKWEPVDPVTYNPVIWTFAPKDIYCG